MTLPLSEENPGVDLDTALGDAAAVGVDKDTIFGGATLKDDVESDALLWTLLTTPTPMALLTVPMTFPTAA